MNYLGVLLLLVTAAFALSINTVELNDCISAEVLCKNDTRCNNSYHVLKNCSRADTSYLLNSPECQDAAKLISSTSFIHCKCHRTKKEESCLAIYWTIHPVFIPGNLASYNSPYTDELDTKEEPKHTHPYEQDLLGDSLNACIHEANVCSSNEKCSQLKNDYVLHCRITKPEGSCDRRKCHAHLRSFIKKLPAELTKRLLFCPCEDRNCGERRRQNIVPKCSFEEKNKRNCLELYDSCMSENLCRSRLLDYQKQCHLSEKNREGCSPEQRDQCIKSYIRMIGTTVTPNFINNSSMDTSLWCTCEGSANKEEECNSFLQMFTSNKCLRKDISPDINQSLIMPLNTQRSLPDDTNLDILDKVQRPPEASSGVSAPSFTLLSPALFMGLLKVVSLM